MFAAWMQHNTEGATGEVMFSIENDALQIPFRDGGTKEDVRGFISAKSRKGHAKASQPRHQSA